MSNPHCERVDAVDNLLQGFSRVAVAVSGGIDSLTLAVIAGRRHKCCDMFHAVSPAVPPEATARCQHFAAIEGWRLQIIDAGEFSRQDYLSNPVNRCFYCKQSLYGAIVAMAGNPAAQIVAGTNTDDIKEYRPGLDAARDSGVRHPFLELGATKTDIRSMARVLGLDDIAELPSSPCLSSRVETGIDITAGILRLINAAETLVRTAVSARAIRCRIRQSGVVIEIDAESLARLTGVQKLYIEQTVSSLFAAKGHVRPVGLAPYKIGSAFLVKNLA